MASINVLFVRKTGPEFCKMDSKSSNDSTLDLNSWDLVRYSNIKIRHKNISGIFLYYNNNFK